MDCGAHLPVLAEEAVSLLQPSGRGVILDCTVGAGGHAERLLAAAGDQATLIGIDVDPGNLKLARLRLDRFGPKVRLFEAAFSQADQVLAEAGLRSADLVLADLGVCSVQLDDPRRGLSFAADGPLDMRLGRSRRTAADLVNRLPEKDLADLIYRFGQERYSRRIARGIVRARQTRPIERTVRLAEIIASALPRAVLRNRRGVHPATRTFLALRIAVNDEMQELAKLLDLLGEVLSSGGTAGVISFHSLEDGQVKRKFAELTGTGDFELLTKKPVTPSDREMAKNPRSRSAKLRGIRRSVV